jgi:hypothetical protein
VDRAEPLTGSSVFICFMSSRAVRLRSFAIAGTQRLLRSPLSSPIPSCAVLHSNTARAVPVDARADCDAIYLLAVRNH